MDNDRKLARIGLLLAMAGFLFQIALQYNMRLYAMDGMYFQKYSSEKLMQTVSIQDLNDAPLVSLFNIHVQPPGLDILRAILVHLSSASDIQYALRDVDAGLYRIWAMVYSLLGFMIFWWTAKLTSLKIGLAATIVFLLHPASIFYATLVDTTLLTSFLVLWMYYLLWEIKNQPGDHIIAFSVATLALFFFRSMFQWPAVFLLGVCLFLLKVPKRQLILFLLIAGGISGIYIAKQYFQFGILSTSSLTGINLAKSVEIIKFSRISLPARARDTAGLPNVLTRETKLDGSINYNNINFLDVDKSLTAQYTTYMVTGSKKAILKSYLENLQIYFEPSSQYTSHVIVDRLPWRSIYDVNFSFPIFPILILIASALFVTRTIKQRTYATALAMLLPGLFVFVASVLFDQGENMRFKFFLEPCAYVFIVSELYGAIQQVRQRFLARQPIS